MSIKHYIAPVASGKTTFALDLYRKTENSTIIFPMRQMYDVYEVKNPIHYRSSGFRGRRFSKVIMDEYILYYQKLNSLEKTMLYDWVTEIVLPRTDELIIISTPDRFYDMMIWFALFQDLNFIELKFFKRIIDEKSFINLEEQIKELNEQFLIPKSNVELILDKFEILNSSPASLREMLQNLGELRYKNMIEGKFLK